MKKRVLSSIGIGGATVDTVLPGVEFSPGEVVDATVDLTGGDSTQEISGLYFSMKAREAGGNERMVSRFTVEDPVTLEPNQELSIPVAFRIPLWAPLTRGDVTVRLETGVDISWSVDPSDEDEIDIVPDDQIAALFDAVDALGFTLHSAKLVDIDYLDDRPYAQKFDFRPTDEFAEDIDDVEITILPQATDLRVLLEIDRVDEIAEEYDLDFDEQEVSISFEHANAEMVENRIRREIQTQIS